MKKILRRIAGLMDWNDIFMLAGAGLFLYGAWLVYRPAAFMLGGLGLGWWGFTGWRSSTRSK
jgi:hypothetical protein